MSNKTNKKKYIIHCDLEGISGIVNYDQVNPGNPLYVHGQKLFTAELNSLVEGLHEGGAEEIYTYDHHYFGINIDISKIPSYVRLICGKPLYKDNWTGEKGSPFSGAILLGLHSKACTSGGLLAHSYEHDIKDIRINGFSVGEIGMEAAIAGDFDVPILLITGDSKGVEEAKSIIRNIESVVVKDSLGSGSAVCFPLKYTTAQIRSAAKKIVIEPPEVNLFKFNGPVTLEVELYHTQFLKNMRKNFRKNFEDKDDIITIRKGSVIESWSEYLRKKLSVL